MYGCPALEPHCLPTAAGCMYFAPSSTCWRQPFSDHMYFVLTIRCSMLWTFQSRHPPQWGLGQNPATSRYNYKQTSNKESTRLATGGTKVFASSSWVSCFSLKMQLNCSRASVPFSLNRHEINREAWERREKITIPTDWCNMGKCLFKVFNMNYYFKVLRPIQEASASMMVSHCCWSTRVCRVC